MIEVVRLVVSLKRPIFLYFYILPFASPFLSLAVPCSLQVDAVLLLLPVLIIPVSFILRLAPLPFKLKFLFPFLIEVKNPVLIIIDGPLHLVQLCLVFR